MITKVMSAARNTNPGVVPPWLQGGYPAGPTAALAPVVVGRDAQGRPVTMNLPDGYVDREQARSEAIVEKVRDFYKGIGVTDAEGADPAAAVEFLPGLNNAEYLSGSSDGTEVDHVHIGIDRTTGRSFNDAEEVVAHEWGHRVINRISNASLSMDPRSEDVAIHESLADTFAAAYDGDDWTMGEDLGEPIRDMANPERLGHPGTMAELNDLMRPGTGFTHPIQIGPGRDDVARGVDGAPILVPDWHAVAGVPNKAASLIGDALGRDTMAQIYLKALRDNVRPGQEIAGLAVATMIASRDLFGADSKELRVTMEAWNAVGVLDDIKGRIDARQAAVGARQIASVIGR